MAVESETTVALATTFALDAVARCTARQLQLLAAMVLIDEIRPKFLTSEVHFDDWLEVHRRPFADIEFAEIDARHLAALSCATYDRASGRGLATVLPIKAVLLIDVKVDLNTLEVLDDLQSVWTDVLAGVSLTSVGSIVGGFAHNQVTNGSLDPPDWK